MMGRLRSWVVGARGPLAALAIVLVVNVIVTPSFLAVTVQDGRLFGSLIDILNRGAPVALLALGMSLVIATRGVDLSVGAVMAIAGACAAAVINSGAPWPLAVAAALAAGLASGLWNGALVAWFGIQPIVATLILMVAGRGVAQLITDGRILTFTDEHLAAIGDGAALGLPLPFLILAVVTALVLLAVRASALGLFVEATGVNPRASWLAGVNASLVLLSVYAISGVTASLAGLVVAADIRGADANNAGLWLELDAILAAVIGGASLYGGRFSLSCAVIGAFTLQAAKTGILRSGLPPEFNLVVMGAVVAVILVLQSRTFTDVARRTLARPEAKTAT